MPSYYQQMLQGRKRTGYDMVMEIVLYDAAIKKGIDQDKETKAMLQEAQKKILISKLIKDEVDKSSRYGQGCRRLL